MRKYIEKLKQIKIPKRAFALVLCLCIAAAILPQMFANATDEGSTETKKAIGFSTALISNPTEQTKSSDSWNGDYVYFGHWGTYSLGKYRVLSKNTTDYSQDSSAKTMLLEGDEILYVGTYDKAGTSYSSAFDTTKTNAKGEWSSSTLKSYLNGDNFLNNKNRFSGIELSAIAGSYKSTKNANDGAGLGATGEQFAALDGEKIFILDAVEATRADYGYKERKLSGNSVENLNNARKKNYNSNTKSYWIRTTTENSNWYINEYGVMAATSNASDAYIGVSPALNIDLSRVVFSQLIKKNASSISGQNAGYINKTSSLSKVSDVKLSEAAADNGGNLWKLTLLDDAKKLSITEGSLVTRDDNTITVPYTWSDENSDSTLRMDQISVMITDNKYDKENPDDAQILYYGQLAKVETSESKRNGSGTTTFTLPSEYSDLKCGTDYYVYIVAERVRDLSSKSPDYASEPVYVAVPDKAEAIEP